MNLESFRRALSVRHREAARCARARTAGERCDEARLDELDADLFSRESTGRAVADWLNSAPETAAGASSRARVAIALDEGMLARLRPIDRAIESARARGRFEEAGELGEERRAALAAEGARDHAPPGSEAVLRARELGARVRGESVDALVASAQRLLAESVGVAEPLVAPGGGASGARDEAKRRGPGKQGRGGRDGAIASLTGDESLAHVMASWCGAGPALPAALVVPALRELGSDLGVDPHAGLEIAVAVPAASAPIVLEIDPPETVLLLVPAREGFDAFAAALAAWGESLAGRLRGQSLPAEHRLRADRALGCAIGALAASLAAEHAHVRREPLPARRRTLAREVASARLAAAFFLDRDRLLAGNGSRGDGERAAMEEASLGRARSEGASRAGGASGSAREPVFDAEDRLRGHFLAPHLRERLRTRFGNLWYRERGAGRWLREACEPGGSLTIAEVLAGLSLPAPSAESLVDSWRDELKRLR